MNGELLKVVEQVGREKGIETEIIIAALEEAIVMASKKYFRTNEELMSHLDRATGHLSVFARKAIVENVEDPDLEITLEEALKIDETVEMDGVVDIPKPTDGLGRIAAQAAKQVIYQKVREAERDLIYAEYSERIGEVVTGLIKRFEKGDLIIDLGKTEAVCPRKEQARHENYRQDDRIRAVIVEVNRLSKGPQVVTSRTSPILLKHLFEMEVPEIYDGTISIVEAVREPGERAKVAVISRESDVDPVGACVGMKGVRVQSIIRELRGEKIDIVQWSPETTTFAMNALNPAKVNRVHIIDDVEKILEVVVNEDQLSLAIGKRGQNVRLAAKLLGWRIDIKSEEEKRREVEVEMERGQIGRATLEELGLVSGKTLESLNAHHYVTLGQVCSSSVEELCEVPGIGPKTAEKIFADATAEMQDQIDQFLAEKLAEEEAEFEEFFDDEPETPAAVSEQDEATTPDAVEAPVSVGSAEETPAGDGSNEDLPDATGAEEANAADEDKNGETEPGPEDRDI
jgi:N utilization substance protein A